MGVTTVPLLLALTTLLAGCDRLFSLDGLAAARLDGGADDAAEGAASDAPTPCLAEPFNVAILPPWYQYTDPGGPEIDTSAGDLAITLVASSATILYGGIGAYLGDFTGAMIDVEVVQTPAAAAGAEMTLRLSQDNQNNYYIAYESGALSFARMKDGTRDNGSVYVAFNSSHRFWRIEHDAASSEVAFSTSLDRQTWTERRRIAATVAVTAAEIDLFAGTYESVAAPGVARFDNVIATGCTGP